MSERLVINLNKTPRCDDCGSHLEPVLFMGHVHHYRCPFCNPEEHVMYVGKWDGTSEARRRPGLPRYIP